MENDAEQVEEDKGKESEVDKDEESEEDEDEDEEEEFEIEFEITDDGHEKAAGEDSHYEPLGKEKRT